MFIKRKTRCRKKCNESYEDMRMRYVDAGGRESCVSEKCRNKCNKCDVFIKCCD